MRHNGLWAVDDRFVTTLAQNERAAAKADGKPMSALMGGISLAPDEFTFAHLVEDTAVIPARGVLMHRFSWWAWSYEEIARDLELAIHDDRADRIVLDIDSPGGLVAGVEIAIAAIERAKAVKPVVAMVNGAAGALSAAFWVASACGRIFATPSAYSGSVGAVISYLDIEPMLIAAGARRIEVVSDISPNKRLDPESAEGKAELKALVDASGERFVTDLARLRGRTEAEILSRFGQGLMFTPAAALERGMIDEIATAEEVIGGQVTDGPDMETEGPDTVAEPDEEEVAMKPNPGSGAEPKLTVAALKSDNPELANALIEEGRAAANAEAKADAEKGLAAERTRVSALDDLLAKMGASEEASKIVAEAKADGSTVEATALKLISSSVAQKSSLLNAMAEDDATAAAGTPAGEGTGPATFADTEEGWKAQFAADTKLQSEFGAEKNYIAHRRYLQRTGTKAA